MAIIRWEPFRWAPTRDMERALRQFDRMFGRWPRLTEEAGESAIEWSPLADITETEKEYLIKAELPEVKAEDIKITVENGMLTLSGERRQEKEAKGEKMHRVERFYGSFLRSFELPADADGEHIRAESKDGVLAVHVPKLEVKKPKPIEIKVQ